MADLHGKRILVTGGAGFIGSQTVDLLMAEGCAKIVVLDNLVRGRIGNLGAIIGHPRLELVTGDICDTALLDRLVADSDIVFHMAALRITHCAAEPDEAMRVMIDATYALARLCVQHKVEKVIYSSSASIYGLAEQFPTDEAHHPYDNRTLYGAAKSFGEGLLRSFNDMYGLDYIALRYFNAYGPRMDIHGRYTEVMVRWMERIDAGVPPIIFGDGLQTMDLIHVTDIARANILAAKSDLSDQVFNVASETETSLLDLAMALARVMGREDLIPEHQPTRAINPVPRRLGSTRKAADLLGFRSSVAPGEGLADLVEWWRAEREAAPITEKVS